MKVFSRAKNLLKPLSNFRFPGSSTFNNLFISEGHGPDLKTVDIVEDKHMLLLKRFHGGVEDSNAHYFSRLSPQDLSPAKKLYLPLFEEFKFVVGSCNGLVCLDSATKESVLWNPSTGEVRIIPSAYMKRFTRIALRYSFASGFGYDSESEDLKIIRFINGYSWSYEINEWVVELYSVKSGCWKNIDFPGYFVLRNPSAYVNGYGYWLAIGMHERFILSFDFGKEEFVDQELPGAFLANTSLHFDFVEFDGCLGVIVFPKLGTEKHFELWVNAGNGRSWIKEFDVCVPGAERPLGFWKNNQVLFFEGINRQLIEYDFTTGKATNLDIYDYPGKMQLIKVIAQALLILLSS